MDVWILFSKSGGCRGVGVLNFCLVGHTYDNNVTFSCPLSNNHIWFILLGVIAVST